jgi:hypothetical protein
MKTHWLMLVALLAGCSKSDNTSKQSATAGSAAATAPTKVPDTPHVTPPASAPAAPVRFADALEGDTIGNIVTSGKHVYWIEKTVDGSRNSILRHSTGTGSITKSNASSFALAVDADHVYYSGSSGSVRRDKHDDESSSDSIAPIKYASAIAIDGDTVFVEDHARVDGKPHAKIWRATKAEPKAIADAESIEGLTTSGHRLYFVRDKKEVVSVDVDGKDVKVLSDKPGDLYVDDHHVYSATDDAVWRVALEGGAPEQVIAGSFVLSGGDGQRVFVLPAKDPGVFAIDKKTKVKSLVSTETALGVRVGADGLYLNQYRKIVRIPLP